MEDGVLAELCLGGYPDLPPANYGNVVCAQSTYLEELWNPSIVDCDFVEQEGGGFTYRRTVPSIGQLGRVYNGTEGVSSLLEQHYFSWSDPRRYGGVTDMMSSIDDILNRAITMGIIVPKPQKVKEYLFGYPDVTDIVEYFFENCHDDLERLKIKNTLSLGIYHDPEFNDEYLILNVRPGTDDEEAVDEVFGEIDSIRDKYIPQTVGKSGWFQVAIDVTS